jgi:hypothetical protein
MEAMGLTARLKAAKRALKDSRFAEAFNLERSRRAAAASGEDVRVIVADILKEPPFSLDLRDITFKLEWNIRAVPKMEPVQDAMRAAGLIQPEPSPPEASP